MQNNWWFANLARIHLCFLRIETQKVTDVLWTVSSRQINTWLLSPTKREELIKTRKKTKVKWRDNFAMIDIYTKKINTIFDACCNFTGAFDAVSLWSLSAMNIVPGCMNIVPGCMNIVPGCIWWFKQRFLKTNCFQRVFFHRHSHVSHHC